MKAINLLTQVNIYLPSIYRALTKYACNLYRKFTCRVLKDNRLLSSDFFLTNFAPSARSLRVGSQWASSGLRRTCRESRSPLEGESGGGRTTLEQRSKKGRRNAVKHQMDVLEQFLAATRSISAFNQIRTLFYRQPSLFRFCTAYFPSLTREMDGAGTLQLRCRDGEVQNKVRTRLKQSTNQIQIVLVSLLLNLKQNRTFRLAKSVPLVYGVFTGSVPILYREGTEKLLRRYQRATKASSLAVDLQSERRPAWEHRCSCMSQACVMHMLSNGQAWIVRKTLPVDTLSMHYQRSIYASSILDRCLKNVLIQISAFKRFNLFSQAYGWFFINNASNLFKSILNRPLASGIDVIVQRNHCKIMKTERVFSLRVLLFFNLLDCVLTELKSIRTYSLLVLMFSMFSLSAQTPRKDSGADGLSHLIALKPGDKIPDAVWNQTLELNYFDGKKKTIKFSDLKGKLIILDFWATWCPSCIEGFPHMQEVKNMRKDNIEVLLVNSIQTKDTHNRVSEVIKRYIDKYDYQTDLPYIFGDTLFQKLFPHSTLPHVVWINKEGMLVANTYPNALTTENINAVLSNGNVNLHQKELRRDSEKSKLTDHWLIKGCYGGSLFKTYEEGQSPSYGKYSFNEDHTSFQIVNLSFPVLLAMAFDKELKGIPWRHWVFGPEAGFYNKQEILATGYKNIFSYEMLVKGHVSKATVKQSFKEDFKQFFGIDISVAEKPIDVWKIVPNAKIEEIKSRGGIPEVFTGDSKTEMKFRNIPLELLIDNLSLYFVRPLLLEENNQLRVDITIPRDFGDWDDHKRMSFLDSMGLELVPLNKSLLYARFSPNNVGEESGS
ncbi:TlpA family protein disulfide reductase [Sphingobacterium faecium]|uniref:TlpA family protein disulfide reductase n=1 Tax=Sphingobacterium faecium TaxID=34087 RepID=UPI00320A97AD